MSNQSALGRRRSDHKLVGCHNRLFHQITRLSGFVEKITSTLRPDEQEQGQFVMQMIAIVAHTFAEAYFKCLFSVATIHRESVARTFLRKQGVPSELGALDAGCNLGELTAMMHRRVRFGRKRARALQRAFEVLFEFDAFPDDRTTDLLIDLAKVRHLIVHKGAWPEESHAREITAHGVIVQTDEIDWDDDPEVEGGKTRFYKLDLINRFLPDALVALRDTALYHNDRLMKHPRWKL